MARNDFTSIILFATALGLTSAAEIKIKNPEYLRDHAATRGFRLGRPTQSTPTPDGRSVLFLRSGPRSPKLELFEYDVGSKKAKLLASPESILKGAEEKLSPEEKAMRERMRVSLSGFTSFQLSRDGKRILLTLSGKLYVLERDSGEVRELKTGKGTLINPKFALDSKQVAYVLDYDVYVFDLENDKERRVTTGGTELVSHGIAEFVAQEEMNRFSGYWWSPDSRHIAYQESDSREVEVWYVADPGKPDQEPYPSRYPRPGKNNVKVKFGIIATTGGDTKWIEWDQERYPYLATVEWDEHGPLTIGLQTRDQKEFVLLEVDASTGQTKQLLKESDSTWLNLRQDVPEWISPKEGFIWASESSGDWQVQWRTRDGSLKQNLPLGKIALRGLTQVQHGSRAVVFSGAPDPTQTKVYQIHLSGDAPRALTPEDGWHSGRFNRSGSLFVAGSTTLGSMPHTRVHKAGGALIGELPSVAENPPFVPRVEILRTPGEKHFFASVVRPRDFNSRKRYPVLVDVYGGPLPAGSAGNVTAMMTDYLLPQWLADQGFILVSVDGRGISGRGRDWERAVYKKFGAVPLEDQVAGLKELGKRYRELDIERAGIYGWSFGGYMSALAVLKEPKVFKAGCAGAPVTDWYDYDTHYTERYLGIPPKDDPAYEASSLLPLAKNLSRPLLLIHGTSDDNVYFRHSLKLADALFRTGKDFEILPLSSFTHMVADPVVNEQLYSRIVRFFKHHLGEPK